MNRQTALVVVRILAIIGSLYLFVVGVGGMGFAFKLFGREFTEQVLTTTAAPVVGLFIGVLATSLVQSSSTSTSVIIGVVAGGAITLEGAIPMIMGANIGTTLTSALVALGHINRPIEFRRAFSAASLHIIFNLLAVLILFPLELATGFLRRGATILAGIFQNVGGMQIADPLSAATDPAIELLAFIVGRHPIALLILTLLLTFAMLVSIVKLLRGLVLQKIEGFFDTHLFKNARRAMLFGLVLTVAVQTSSIPTSLVIPLAGAGVLRLVQVFPFSVGSNIGTTITAMLAALATANITAITVAFCHFLFNIFGLIFIWSIPPIRRIPLRLAEIVAEFTMRNRSIPVILIAMLFFIIPAVMIWIAR